MSSFDPEEVLPFAGGLGQHLLRVVDELIELAFLARFGVESLAQVSGSLAFSFPKVDSAKIAAEIS